MQQSQTLTNRKVTMFSCFNVCVTVYLVKRKRSDYCRCWCGPTMSYICPIQTNSNNALCAVRHDDDAVLSACECLFTSVCVPHVCIPLLAFVHTRVNILIRRANSNNCETRRPCTVCRSNGRCCGDGGGGKKKGNSSKS